MSAGGRSQYDRVRADQIDMTHTILVTFDPDAVPDSPAHNPGLPGQGDKPLLIAGRRTGVLRGTVSITHHDLSTGLVRIDTEHGPIVGITEGCPVWKVRA